MHMEQYDIIVVGGGHAGAEAAYAASRLGVRAALFSINLDTIGRMPCSPSIGGLAKSHLVKEIDALGGIMALAADETAIQYRILNTKKGPAVRATRTQNDRHLYETAIKARLEKMNIEIRQSRVEQIEVAGSKVIGITDQTGTFYGAQAVIIAAGTFLSGTVHIGEHRFAAGRAGEEGSYALATSLKNLGFSMGRHKTGTPPRLDRDSINLDALEKQDPLDGCLPFAFASTGSGLRQLPCYLGRTSPQTHAVIKQNIHLSALYSGAITGTPARYCPSLEDKVMRFGERGGHQVIIEPEGLNTKEVYASGLGNSLPVELQWEIVQSVMGLESAKIMRPAYAIEYDFIYPTQLTSTLETKRIEGLYLAGQVNGTSGYEEAAGQGIMAGINAALKIQGRRAFVLDRSQAYIGVMVDDLTVKGTSEPYRMFTSRAEYRLMLRETNAHLRLSKSAYDLGLISSQRFEQVRSIQQEIHKIHQSLNKTTVVIPEDLPDLFKRRPAERTKLSLADLLKRPEIHLHDFQRYGLVPDAGQLSITEAEVEIKYEGYIKRQLKEVARFKELEEVVIPTTIDYKTIQGLSNELKTSLAEIRPRTLSQAALLEGMTPAGLKALQIGIKATNPLL